MDANLTTALSNIQFTKESIALGVNLFSQITYGRMRGTGHKVKQGRLRFDIGKNFMTERVLRHWNRLPREVVEPQSLVKYSKAVWM